jgi:cysteine-S-conjugate beta-lyase
MIYNFDLLPDRRPTESIKWKLYGPDVLPMWVADMDFVSPEPVIHALRERVEHGVFGYPQDMPEINQVIAERMQRLYGWQVAPEDVVLLPGVVTGFNMACQAFAAGKGVLVQTPVYPPFLSAPGNASSLLQESELVRDAQGVYSIDWDSFNAAITPQTRLFILCNPHNPVGRVFSRSELERMAQICLKQHILICSDEIHCDLVYTGNQHIPIASLDPEIARRTVTLIAPSKTYNIAGLESSIAIIQEPALRKQFLAGRRGLVGWVNIFGQIAALAAYRDGQEWLDQLLRYLEDNRDYLADFVHRELPSISMGKPEGTYLAWLDCRGVGLDNNPQQFFLEKALVAMNNGATFGRGGEGFVRLNFGCPRSMLVEAMDRIKNALAQV